MINNAIPGGFKMTGLGLLHEEWEVVRWDRVGQINTETTPRRMNHAMDEYKLEKPIIEADENWFTIIFKRLSERWSEKGITERVMGINTKIKKNPRVSRKHNIQLKLINDTD
jgi:hypothetical protein